MKDQLKLFLTRLRSSRVFPMVILFTVICSNSIHAQIKTVKGTITDEIGLPLPGANVLEKGTRNGVTTDFDGNYSIQVTNKSVLSVSYLGYKTSEVEVGTQLEINVSLIPDLQQLEETVVIGYGSVKRKDVTGSVASVKMDKLTEAPVANFDQALGGRVTGVQVSSGSGEPGEGSQIVIRGGNTVNGDNSPLYVLDGFIVEDFNPGLIDPTDIQNIDILKDASATAIYGARGANGVVLITTKQAKSGKTTVTYETRLDVKEVSKKIPVLNGEEYVKLVMDINPTYAKEKFFEDDEGNVGAEYLDPADPIYPAQGAALAPNAYEAYKDAPYKNWQDVAFRTAYSKTHRIKISNGTDKTKINASFNALDDEGTLINTEFKKLNGTLNLKHKIGEKTNVSLGVIYASTVQSGLDTKGTSSYSFLRNLISYTPVVNRFRDYGDINPLNEITDDFFDDGIFNWHPILSLENEYRKRQQDQFIVNLSVRYKIIPSLTFETKVSYNGLFRQTGIFNNSKTVYGRLINPISGINGSLDYNNFRTLSNINTLTFNKTFGNHNVNAMLGHSVNTKNITRTLTRAVFIPEYAEPQGINALDEGDLTTSNDFNGSNITRIESFWGRINYSLKNRYLLTASIRRDGSSKFAPGFNIGYFPSLALSWKAEEEAFIKKLGFISQLKFKGGYGKTGNDRIPGDARFDLYTSSQASYFLDGQEILGQRPTSSGANPFVKWETTEQYNVGVNLGLFDGRISIGAEAYEKTTEDLLINADVGPSLGVSKKWVNLGSVRNRGLEFSLSTLNVNTENFKWTTDFNISFNKNEVLELPEGKPIFGNPNYYWQYASNQFIVEEGQPLGNMYGYLSDGVYQYDDFVDYPNSNTLNAGQPSYVSSHQPGDAKYKDLNGDGNITDADKTIMGNGLPEHFGGFSNTFTYKNFELSTFFQWSYGNDILNANRLVFEQKQLRHLNQYATILDRWTETNQGTDEFRAGGEQGFQVVSSRIVEDGSYIRLKTVNLSYNLNKDILDKLKLSSLKLYLSAQNLITWTDYSGFDPEVSVNRSAIMPGVDYSAYPRSKTFSVGLNLTF